MVNGVQISSLGYLLFLFLSFVGTNIAPFIPWLLVWV